MIHNTILCAIPSLVIATSAGFVLASDASAQISFVDVTEASGLGTHEVIRNGGGSGACAADYDDDGFVDVFVPTDANAANLLYRNLGDGQFEDVAEAAGVAGRRPGRSCLWVDVDGDRRLDLLVGGDCHIATCDAGAYLQLYRQQPDGTFVDVTAGSGLVEDPTTPSRYRTGFAAGDVNGDGYLDVVTTFWRGALRLYLNRGDGTFDDASLAAGLDVSPIAYHQPLMADMNGDGLLDIFATVDFIANRFWLHQGLGGDGMPSFVEVAAATGSDNAMNDMGITVGDYDLDGDPDLYVTNILGTGEYNILLRNDPPAPGRVAFSEVSAELGVRDGGWGWGTTFLDVDNDGDVDLAETNGWNFASWNEPMRLFENLLPSSAIFVDRAAAAGLTGTDWGSALVAFDADRDGDLDLVETQQIRSMFGFTGRLALYQNQLDGGSPDHHFLLVRPRNPGPNARAVGARVIVEAGGRTMIRWITAGTSFLGQEPAEAFFGLGSATVAERVTIAWPGSGSGTTVLDDVRADQILTPTLDALLIDGFETGDTSAWPVSSAWSASCPPGLAGPRPRRGCASLPR